MIAENRTAPHINTFKQWVSTLIQQAEQDDRLRRVASKLHSISGISSLVPRRIHK
jgi:hypothetical protein